MVKQKEKKPLYEVLAEAGEVLTPHQLFEQAGFTIEWIDEFYEELRHEVQIAKTIRVDRENGEYRLEARL